MKIAILSCFYPFRGGIAQFNANLLTELSKTNDVRGFNFIRQYPSFLFPGTTQYVSPTDTDALVVESTPVLDTANPFNWTRTAKAIRSWGPDVVIVRYWMPYFAPSLGAVLRHIPCKKIAILDNVIPHERRFFDKAFTSWFLKAVDANITLCSEVANDLLSISPKSKYLVLNHPIYSHFGDSMPKEEALEALNLPKEGRYLLFFGLIREYKGLDILIEAFKKLDKRYHLIVAGEPYGSFEKYEQQLEDCDKERVHLFLKYIGTSEVKKYFGASDLVVLPYRSATQSGVSSIANHFEVPMLVTDVGGLKETIGDKGTGIVCSSLNADKIAELIENYFNNPELKYSFIENIKKENERLSWKNFCKDLTEFIDKL